MHGVERRPWLVARARAAGRVSVSEVADELGLAPETIRRDLSELEEQGLLRRVYGGAIPVERLGFEGHLTSRTTAMSEQKRRIGAAALPLLRAADVVYLDEGSTTQALAEQLLPERALTVVTSSLPIATALAERPMVTVLLLGGRVRANTLGTVEHWATRMLESFVIDIALVGANGVSIEYGLTAADPAVAAVKSTAIAASARRVLLADSTKFGVNSFCRFAALRDLHVIVTDDGLSEADAERYAGQGSELIRA